MRKSRFTGSQIVAIVQEADTGIPIKGLVRKHGISIPTTTSGRASQRSAADADP